MEFSKLKQNARSQIRGNILTLFLCGILVAIITGAASFVIIGSLVVAGPLTYGMVCNNEAMAKNEKANVGNLFKGFTEDFVGSFLVSLLMGLYVFFWTLLLIIPGLIKAFSYSMSMYIKRDNPNMSASECITRSREIMNGNKLKLFLFELSYIGWILLGMVTLGIAFIWVGPYIEQGIYNFYLEIKDNYFGANAEANA